MKQGDVELANQLLGRPYSVEGVVQQGRQLGRTLGFPTINVPFPNSKAQIPFGVYSVDIELEGDCFKGILNYGIKPTVAGDLPQNLLQNLPLLEIHIFDFNKNVYNKPVRINLLKWIREERKFGSLDELKIQIEKDLKEC